MTTSDTAAVPSGARNATLADLAGLLRDQQARKVDGRFSRPEYSHDRRDGGDSAVRHLRGTVGQIGTRPARWVTSRLGPME